MKIAIVTLYTDDIRSYATMSEKNKRSYASRHGYDFFAYSGTLDASRPPAWSKIPAIQAHLPEYDWVFWTDADSIVMEPRVTLESILQGNEDKDMILTWQADAPFNTGQWLIRNTVWSMDLLDTLLGEHTPNKWPHWWEQGALTTVLQQDTCYRDRIALVHPRIMNSTPAFSVYSNELLDASRYREGDFIIHFWPLARDVAAITRLMSHFYLKSLTATT